MDPVKENVDKSMTQIHKTWWKHVNGTASPGPNTAAGPAPIATPIQPVAPVVPVLPTGNFVTKASFDKVKEEVTSLGLSVTGLRTIVADFQHWRDTFLQDFGKSSQKRNSIKGLFSSGSPLKEESIRLHEDIAVTGPKIDLAGTLDTDSPAVNSEFDVITVSFVDIRDPTDRHQLTNVGRGRRSKLARTIPQPTLQHEVMSLQVKLATSRKQALCTIEVEKELGTVTKRLESLVRELLM
ncbi:hypothetical protein B0H65DRAFT_550388 [Neurospora tetraspora]|uniref:Uncharacterized protein n=1 Tax=Neurospora tetraspora TaxID=94610 RepID=A0AAE0JDL4_9PEZI|nr:hypothetical protein B0H65DRAFT_550388 [Neurospora tetraspora]